MLAPVVDLQHVRRRHQAARLARLGVPIPTIVAADQAGTLERLHHRETLIADISRLCGSDRNTLHLWDDDELDELHDRMLQQLMRGGPPNADVRPIHMATPGRIPKRRVDQRRAERKAWGLGA